MCAAEETGPAAILHADLDAFYAAVEQLLDPALPRPDIAMALDEIAAWARDPWAGLDTLGKR